jgi:SAM-dependent methyltransferase
MGRSTNTLDPVRLYGRALELTASTDEGCPCRAVELDGASVTLPLARWIDEPDEGELDLLERLPAPVLDIGCGPGRHVAALHARGVQALGLDVATAAVDLARKRGAPIFEGSVFYPVPNTGRWGSALLLDGNVGIGGDPAALLRRVHQLLRAGGELLVEVDPACVGVEQTTVRLETADAVSAWFPWTRVGLGGVLSLAARTGFELGDEHEVGARQFVTLRSVAARTGRFERTAAAQMS